MRESKGGPARYGNLALGAYRLLTRHSACQGDPVGSGCETSEMLFSVSTYRGVALQLRIILIKLRVFLVSSV